MSMPSTVPMAAESLATKVKIDVLVAGFGENDPVTPSGRPVTLRVTGESNPPEPLMSTKSKPLCPCTSTGLFGAANNVKDAGSTETTTETLHCAVQPEPTPWITKS